MRDTAHRKYQITINNPLDHGVAHKDIREALEQLKSVVYWCMGDEIGGEENTLHTHIFLVAKSPIRFSTLKKRFPEAHIEPANGTCQQNRDYIFKEGKWEKDEKHGTKVPNTQEEWGEMPADQPGHRSDFDRAFESLEGGSSVMDVIREMPHMLRYKSMLEQTRQELMAERFRKEFRHLDVTYIFGATGLGKTRYVMEQFGYENVCQVTGYLHGCFDKYKGEPVILFDEFSTSLKMQDMLVYLDGYPLELPCRYANKVACYDKVFIVSNLPLQAQYPNVQKDVPAVWQAFLRRINHVIEFTGDGIFAKYAYTDHLEPEGWQEIPNTGDLPF